MLEVRQLKQELIDVKEKQIFLVGFYCSTCF